MNHLLINKVDAFQSGQKVWNPVPVKDRSLGKFFRWNALPSWKITTHFQWSENLTSLSMEYFYNRFHTCRIPEYPERIVQIDKSIRLDQKLGKQFACRPFTYIATLRGNFAGQVSLSLVGNPANQKSNNHLQKNDKRVMPVKFPMHEDLLLIELPKKNWA